MRMSVPNSLLEAPSRFGGERAVWAQQQGGSRSQYHHGSKLKFSNGVVVGSGSSNDSWASWSMLGE